MPSVPLKYVTTRFKSANMTGAMQFFSRKRLATGRRSRHKALFRVLALLLAVGTTRAAQSIPTDSPLDFFTNVAARVLQTEMGVDLIHIQVYPTNQYTPAVHRLLQVTANL